MEITPTEAVLIVTELLLQDQAETHQAQEAILEHLVQIRREQQLELIQEEVIRILTEHTQILIQVIGTTLGPLVLITADLQAHIQVLGQAHLTQDHQVHIQDRDPQEAHILGVQALTLEAEALEAILDQEAQVAEALVVIQALEVQVAEVHQLEAEGNL